MHRTLEPEIMDTVQDAEEYDAMDFSATDTQFAERTVALLGEARGVRALDIGTGTAKIPVLLLARRPDINLVAIEMAGEMLRLAAKNLQAAGLSQACSLRCLDAKALDL